MSVSPEKSDRRTRSRSRGPTKLPVQEGRISALNKYDLARRALQISNDDIDSRMRQVHANTRRLEREISVLSRHINETNSPLMETWEADILTRLIEVAHIRQTNKLLFAIGEENTAERETLARAYSNAARRVKIHTIIGLGLTEKHHDAMQHYSEIAVYRSPNPFATETSFAKWLVAESLNKPDKFKFWARLYPICYGRSVYESANLN